jgi:hypothetical protein
MNIVLMHVITMENVDMAFVSVMLDSLAKTVLFRLVLMNVQGMGNVQKGSANVIVDSKEMIAVLRHVLITAVAMEFAMERINVNVTSLM